MAEHPQCVRTNLIGDVAIGRDAIGAYDDQVDRPARDEMPSHVVGDQRLRDASLLELPGREPGALEEGTGLVDENMRPLAALGGGTNDAKRAAVIDGCEG